MSRRFLFLLPLLAGAIGCGNASQSGPGGPGGPGNMPPAPVQAVTLQPRPVPQTSEFVATIQSMASTTIQPQVEGFITRIFVKSGDRVRAGQVLVQIDPDKQQASVASLEAERAAREADVAYAKQQLERMQKLFTAGAVSQQELEQAQTAERTSEAQLTAIQQQIRESRVQLQYYRVTSPTSGVVGDIPVRTGDRVTSSTGDHDDRPGSRSRGVHLRAARAVGTLEAGVARADSRAGRKRRRDQSDHVRGAARG
jgi:multidrug efflux pump subunit AcrA (membrane-fusion protein)